MIKCKIASDSECGKVCCCVDCEKKETCKIVCTNVSLVATCGNAIEEGNEIVAFEYAAAATIQTIANIASNKNKLDEQEKEMRKKLEETMDLYGIKSFENELIKITYVEPTTRTTVDSAKLKKKYPDVFKECSKVSEVKGSVRINVK